MSNTIERDKMTQSINGKVTRKAKKDPSEHIKFNWWAQPDSKKMADEISATLSFIGKHQSTRMNQLTMATRLYGNSSQYNLLGGQFMKQGNSQANPSATRISFNLVASVVDTVVAQLAKSKVVPMFITSGATWGMQKRAEKLNKFAEGLFYEQDIHNKAVYQARDACVWGDGILHVFRNSKDRVEVERVLPHELLVDQVESMVSQPRQLHRVKVASRDILIDMFPEHEEAIMQAAPANYQQLGGEATAADLITVVASWHLRSGEDANDGMYAVTLPDTGILLDSCEYNKDYFPFVIFPYSRRLLGYWGQGAAERLQNIQGEVNRGMITIQKSIWLQGGPKVFLQTGSKIVAQHINNELGTIIHGNTPPVYFTPPCIQPEVYTWVDSLIAKGYQQEGVSQLAANNLKPMGVNSGAALRTYDTIAEDRHLFMAQRFEDVHLEVLRIAIDIIRDIHGETGKYEVKFGDHKFLETIDWSDVHLEEDEYWIRAFPTSELPEEPTAKLQTVQEYVQAGFITPKAARRLLAMPDVEKADMLASAPDDLIEKSIEDILYEGKSVAIDSEWDLDAANKAAILYLNYAKCWNAPLSRILMLQEFKDSVQAKLQEGQPQAPVSMPGGAMPQANPMAPPQSDLIPNVPGGVQ